MKKQLSFIGLLLLASALFFFQLNVTHLTSWDEAWHAVMARNMARSNDFITPVYNGQVWFATAPFYIWILAIWFKLTNYAIYGVRFFSALAGFSTVYLTFRIGSILKNRKTGLVAGLIIATTIQFLFRARQGNLDAPLAFFNTFAVYCFLRGKDNPKWYWGIGLSTALGFLTKSVLGLFPLGLLMFIPKIHAIKSLLIFVFVASPWHIIATFLHGKRFLNHYFLQYVLTKATNGQASSSSDLFWYINVLKHGLKLWFVVFMPLGLVFFFKISHDIKRHAKKIKNYSIELLLPFFWVVIPFTVLTFAKLRNDWYIISLYPGIAILIAVTAESLVSFVSKKLPVSEKIIKNLYVLGCIGIALTNAIIYRQMYMVPDTTSDEALLSSKAQELLNPNDTLLLDDNYLPVALFYSDRLVNPLRYSRAYESLVQEESLKIATESGARFVLTNTQTFPQLHERLHFPEYETIQKAGDKMLLKLEYSSDDG